MMPDRKEIPEQQKGTTRPFYLRVRLHHLWLILPFVIVLIRAFQEPLRRLDFWWHLKVGQIIVETGRIPSTDIFSMFPSRTEFLIQSWLPEVIYYLTYDMGGPALVIFVNSVLIALALTPILHMCHQRSQTIKQAVFALTPALLVLFAFSNARPQIFAFPLFAVSYWLLADFEQNRRSSVLFFLPLVMLVWVNVHGSFLLGLLLIGLFTMAIAFDCFQKNRPWRDSKQIGTALGVSFAVTFVNPNHYHVYRYFYTVLSDPASQAFVTEWQPPSVRTLTGLLAFFLPLLLALFGFILTSRPIRPIQLVLFLTFGMFGLSALRNGVWFGLIASPILASLNPGKTGILSRVQTGRRLHLKLPSGIRSGRELPLLNLVFLLTMISAATVASPWMQSLIWNKDTLLEDTIPVEAIDFIEDREIKGRIFHPQSFGDYLIWRLWPEHKSFFDGRVHAFEKDYLEKYVLTFHELCWEERLRQWKIEYVLLSKLEESSQELIDRIRADRSWETIFEDEKAVLFDRRDRMVSPKRE